MKNILLYITFIGFCVVSLLQGCSAPQETKNGPQVSPDCVPLTTEQMQMLEINMIKPALGALESYIYLNGRVRALPNLQAQVSSNIEGKIEKIYVLEGNHVRKGQPLMTLSSMQLIELQDAYMNARSERDLLQIEYDRQAELRKNNVGVLADFQITESKFKAAVSREKALAAKLEILGINVEALKDSRTASITKNLTVYSPLEGYVHNLPVSLGMLAGRETILAEIVNATDLQAELQLYEKELDLVSEGQEVELEFINHPSSFLKGKVINIERTVNDLTGSVGVHVKFKAPAGIHVLPDMKVRARILNRKNNKPEMMVPVSSLLEEDGQYYVFAGDTSMQDGKVRLYKKKVKPLDRNDKFSEIRFMNPVDEVFIVANNVLALEAQRKKIHITVP